MLFRMIIHSAVFTVAIAAGAMAMNGVGMLDGTKPGKAKWSSSGYGGNNAYWLKKDDHDDDRKWKRWKHDDD